tara:strand:- start:11513 stop:11758 length:246 start_codon:yes stop_codon:yes gene_type:complete
MNELEQLDQALGQLKESMGLAVFGRSPSLAKAAGQCVKCGEHDLKFGDELSRKEYGISVLCQRCQGGIFNNPNQEGETANE